MNPPCCGGGGWDMGPRLSSAVRRKGGGTGRGRFPRDDDALPLSCYRRAPRATSRRGADDPGTRGAPRVRRGRARRIWVEWNRLNLLDVPLLRRRGAPDRGSEDQERRPVEFQFTTRSQEAVTAAAEKAVELGNPQISSMHLLWALAGQADGIGRAVLAAVGADPAD